MNAVEIYEKASWDVDHSKITFGEFEERIKALYDVDVVVRCTECRHRRLCDQCTEQNGKLYHIEWCSRGEREEQK